MVRSQLGAVQLSYCSEKNQNDKHHLKKKLWVCEGSRDVQSFFHHQHVEKRQAEVRDIFCRGFAKNKPLAKQRWQPDPPAMTSWYYCIS